MASIKHRLITIIVMLFIFISSEMGEAEENKLEKDGFRGYVQKKTHSGNL